MGKMWLILCTSLALLSTSAVFAEDADIQALKALIAEQSNMLREQNARMATQDARLNDLQAKMNESKAVSPEQIKAVTSIRKNAAVTVGGLLVTRYSYTTGNVKSEGYTATGAPDGSGRAKRSEYKQASLGVSKAKLNFKIDVNENVDAYLQVDLLHDTNRITNTAGIAQKYWLRWKNIGDTGFGVLVGRNDLIFTDRYNVGLLTGFLGKQDEFVSTLRPVGVRLDGWSGGNAGEGMFSHRDNVLIPNHLGWDYSRTTQINPYWESSDGGLRFDLSLMQSAERLYGLSGSFTSGHQDGDVREYRSINYGLGSGTFRVRWKPIEGLTLTASVANFYQNNQHGGSTNRWDARRGTSDWAAGHSKWVSNNATATNLSVRYNPSMAKNLNFWGKWTHGWNDGWTKDLDSDSINVGASVSWGDRWTYFAQADFFWNKNKRDVVEQWYKSNLWAFYTGLQYRLSYGVNLELGWRHEQLSFENRVGYTHTKAKLDTIYGLVGFNF